MVVQTFQAPESSRHVDFNGVKCNFTDTRVGDRLGSANQLERGKHVVGKVGNYVERKRQEGIYKCLG